MTKNVDVDRIERKNGKLRVVKKNLILFIITFCFLSLAIHPSQADTIRAINDSFVFTEDLGNGGNCFYNGIACNTTNSYPNHLNLSVGFCGSDGFGGATNYGEFIYYKFPINTSRIISDLRFNVNDYLTTIGAGFSFDPEIPNKKAYWLQNQTWGENFSYVTRPGGIESPFSGSWGNSGQSFHIQESPNIFSPSTNSNFNVSFVKYLYNTIGNASFKFEKNFLTENPGNSWCSLNVLVFGFSWFTTQSHNAGPNSGAFLNITFTDFLTNKVEMTNCPASGGTHFVWFDFESGNASCSFFGEADLQYDLDSNIMYAGQPKGATISGDPSPLSPTNTLDTVNCPALGVSNLYNNNPITDLNPLTSDGQVYSTVCFNLTNQHAGKQFYGAVKVLNNTDVRGGLFSGPDFDFFYALYSPSYTKFSTPVLIPNPPQLGIPLNISWTSTQVLTTVLRYRINQSGSFGAFQTIQDLNFTTAHSVIIDGGSILSGIYDFHYEGNTTTGSYFLSDNYSFTVGTNINITAINSTITQGANGLVNSGFVKTPLDAIYIFGFLMLIMATLAGFYYGGLETGIAAFTASDGMLVGAGLLPFYMLLPLLLTAAFIVTLIIRRVFVGEGGQ